MSNYPRMCALPDHLELAENQRWSKRTIKWCITGTVPGVSEADQKAAYEWAWQQWAAVTGLVFEYTETSREADLFMGSGPIDGQGGILAESELPVGDDRPIHMKFDVAEKWQSQIRLNLVALHEAGHALGLGHEPPGSNAVMAPVYNPAWTGLLPLDVQAIQRLYPYTPPAPTPTPIPPPTSGGVLMTPEQALAAIAVVLNQAGYKVTR